ncbi:hypothetical protein [Shewanella algae]
MIGYVKYFFVPLFIVFVLLTGVYFNLIVAWFGGMEFNILKEITSFLANIATILGVMGIAYAYMTYVRDKKVHDLNQLYEIAELFEKRLSEIRTHQSNINELIFDSILADREGKEFKAGIKFYLEHNELVTKDRYILESIKNKVNYAKQIHTSPVLLEAVDNLLNCDFVVDYGDANHLNAASLSNEEALDFYSKWFNEQQKKNIAVGNCIAELRKLQI